MATPDQIRRRGRWSVVLGAITTAAVFATAAIGADDGSVDGDLGAPGNQNSVSITASAGSPVTTSAGLVITRAGNQAHLTVGNVVVLEYDAATSNLPAGATVSDVSLTIPSPWTANGQQVPGTSSIAFTAPASSATYTVRWKVKSGPACVSASGNQDCFNMSGAFTVNVTVSTPTNQEPVADAGGAYSGAEGASIALDGSGSSDDSGIASYSWTVAPQSGGANDPDSGASCSFVDGTSSSDAQPKVSCTDDGIYDVELTVEDDYGASDDDSTTLTLSNENPSATPSVPAGSVDEGDSFTLALSGATDPGANDSITYQFDCGDGGGYDTAGSTPTRTCPTSDNGSRSVKLKGLDDDGGSAEYTGTVTVANVAPTADGLAATSPIDEGSSSSLSLTDPTDASSVDAASLKYSFACDGLDASLAANYAAAGTANAASCSFADNGTFTVKGRVYDKDGDGTTYTTSVVVNNVPPTVVAGFTAVSVDCQTSATLTIDPADAGANDSPWKVNIDWGDGATEPEITRTNLDSFTVTHVYAAPGAYNATVSVTDKDDGTGSDPTNGITTNQTYTVDFLPPFDYSSPSGLIANKMKNGRVVPVKATIYDDCVEAFVTDPGADVTIRVSKTSGSGGSSDPVEEYADAGQSSAGTDEFRWSTDGFWIYNLDSKALGLVVNNVYRVDIYVGAVRATASNWAVLQPVK